MNKIINRAAEAAKAVVGAATPIITAAVVDIVAELSTLAVGGIAAGATLLTVWLTPNRKPAGS